MDTKPTAPDRYKQSRSYGRGLERRSRDSREYKSDDSMRRSRNDSRNIDYRDRRNRKQIPEDQCISLFPSAKSNSKENVTLDKTPQNNRSRCERRNLPFNRSTQYQSKMDLNEEFPPLGVPSITPETAKDWGTMVEEEEARSQKMPKTNGRYKRRLILSESQEDNTLKHTKPVMVDDHKLIQRQKQIDIGKNTLSYGRYIEAVKRDDRTKEDPKTPDKFQVCSTRSWVGQIKVWRRKLHVWDPPSAEGQEDLFSSSSQSSLQSFANEVKMEVDCNCDADDDMMSNSTPSSVDDLFGDFDIDACFANDGLPL